MKSILFLLACVTAKAFADDYCFYIAGIFRKYQYCDYGCCYTTNSPCCEEPIYTRVPFIAGITTGVVFLILATIGGLVYRRRRYATTTTVQYGQPAIPQVFSTSTSTSSYAGYGNPSYTNVR